MRKLEDVLKENDFIKPNYNDFNIVDLVRALYGRYGISFNQSDNIKELNDIIPRNKHTLLILSDGTGSNLIEKLPSDSILKKNKKKDLLTVFPSTTGCVLTSLVTASFPEQHGIWGWFNYNRTLNRDYCPVLFADRKTEKSLEDYNINSDDIFKLKSMFKKINNKVNVLFPSYIKDSIYSKFVANDSDRYAYANFDDIIKFMKKTLKDEEESFTYLYLPDIDSLEHENGVHSDIVLNKLKEINDLVDTLSKNKDLTIVFTADHGQIDTKHDVVLDFAEYDKYFYAYPSIDYGTATYYIKKEHTDEFVKRFENDFHDKMYLFKTEDFIKNNFFGIGEFSKYSLNNLGEFISICKKDCYFINNPDIEKYYGKIKGNHSGLSKDEMIIPLVVIDTNMKK